jgi:tripartite-type tricarboxylate transporter receptor subunit TctC
MPIIPMIAIAAALLAAIPPAAAQAWPTRPMTMVVPFAAGGASDVIARILAQGLRMELGQSVVVENVGGAGGMVGSIRVAKAAPDGYQMVLGNVGTHAQNQSLYKKPLYHAATDFTPVALVTNQSLILVVRKDFPADNLQTFIAYAKANQAKMQFGSAGTGSPIHLACVLLNLAIAVNVTHIPYRGGAPAMQDLVGGRIDYLCPIATTAIPPIESKQVKAIAILTRNRSPSLPALASAHEQGLASFEAGAWNAIFLPGGTPAAIVQKLHCAAVAAMEAPEVRSRLDQLGATIVTPERRSPEYLQSFVESEIEKWAAPIKAANITAD